MRVHLCFLIVALLCFLFYVEIGGHHVKKNKGAASNTSATNETSKDAEKVNNTELGEVKQRTSAIEIPGLNVIKDQADNAINTLGEGLENVIGNMGAVAKGSKAKGKKKKLDVTVVKPGANVIGVIGVSNDSAANGVQAAVAGVSSNQTADEDRDKDKDKDENEEEEEGEKDEEKQTTTVKTKPKAGKKGKASKKKAKVKATTSQSTTTKTKKKKKATTEKNEKEEET